MPHSAKKIEKSGPLEFFNICSVAKYRKIEGGPFGDINKFSKKVSQSRRSGRFHSAKKTGNLFRNACKKINAYAPVRRGTLWLKSKHLTTKS